MQKITLAKSFKTNGLSKVVVCSLTTGTDAGTDFTGGAGADTFNAGLSAAGAMTLQALDVLNGGAGADTVNISMNASVTPNMTAIETVNASTTAAATLDLVSAAGVTSVSNTGSTALLTVQNIGSSVTSLTLANTALGGTFDFLDSTVTGTSDAKTFTVSNVTGGTLTVDNAVESVTINSSGAANTLAGLATAATTVTFTGAAALTVGGTIAGATTIDGSAATGALTFENANTALTTITTGAGNDSVTMDGLVATIVDTVTLGAGNDTLTYQAAGTLDRTDVLAGGAGTDTLVALVADLDTTNFATASTTITGFDAVTVSNALAGTVTLANIQATGLATVSLAAGGTGTLNFGAGAATVNVAAPLTGLLTVDASGTATSDALTINNTDVAANAFAGQAITTTDFETLTVSTSGTGTATAQTLGAVTMTASTGGTTTLNLSGTNSLTTGAITASAINASGMTAQATGSTFVMGAAAVGVTTITGSAGADTLLGDAASTINGGAGNDTITGGTGNDTLNGDAGTDTITTSTGNDTVNGGAGDDVINVDVNLTSDDTINGGDGTGDTLAMDVLVSAANAVGVTNMEILRADTALTQDMVAFTNNAGFTRVVANNAGTTAFNNAAAAVVEARSVTTTQVTVDRLVDNTSNALTFGAATDAITTVTTLVVDDEETLTISAGAIDSALALTVTTLTAEDLVTLNISGVANVAINGFTDQAVDTLTTVNAADNTGTVTFVGNNNISLGLTMTGSATAASTLTGGGAGDTITGGAVADNLNGGNGSDIINGGAGDDILNGDSGTDTLTGGVGADTITGGVGADSIVLTETSSSADIVVVTAVEGTSSDSGRTTVTGNNNDTGEDTVTGFAFGTDVVRITATAVASFTHGTHTAIGTAIGDVNDGSTGSFLTSVGLVNLDGGVIADTVIGAGDVAINFATPSATMTEALFEAALQYNLTAQAGGSTMVGGALADTLTGGAGVDTITGGAGNDIIVSGGGADTITGGAGADSITLAAAGDTEVIILTGNGLEMDTIVNFTINDTDNVDIDLSDLNALVTDMKLAGDGGTALAVDGTPTITDVAVGAFDLGNAATADILFIAGDYATSALLETALEVGGTTALTTNGVYAAGDGFLVVYDNGVNSFLGLVTTTAGAADNATFAANDLVVTNLVQFTGMADATVLLTGNFDIIA